MLSNPITNNALTALANANEFVHSALAELGDKTSATTMRWGVGLYALVAGPLAQTATPTNCTPVSGTTNGGLNLNPENLRQWMLSEFGSFVVVIVLLCIAWWGAGFLNQSWGQKAVATIRRVLVTMLLLIGFPFLIGMGASVVKAVSGQDLACYIPTTTSPAK